MESLDLAGWQILTGEGREGSRLATSKRRISVESQHHRQPVHTRNHDEATG